MRVELIYFKPTVNLFDCFFTKQRLRWHQTFASKMRNNGTPLYFTEDLRKAVILDDESLMIAIVCALRWTVRRFVHTVDGQETRCALQAQLDYLRNYLFCCGYIKDKTTIVSLMKKN
jgi:hypothetical protein